LHVGYIDVNPQRKLNPSNPANQVEIFSPIAGMLIYFTPKIIALISKDSKDYGTYELPLFREQYSEFGNQDSCKLIEANQTLTRNKRFLL
jgi:hypothetical protein